MVLGPIVGRGREAEIYEWNDDAQQSPQILKLYFSGQSGRGIERDLESSRTVAKAGIPTPAVYGEIVELDGRLGLVYERIDGRPMLEMMAGNLLRIRSYSRLVADLHFSLHAPKVSGLRPVKEKLKQDISRANAITDDEISALLDLTDSMPDGDRIYHGDFHPDNIIFRTAEQGGPVIIDWSNAGSGDPLADVARTHLLTMFGWRGLPSGFNRWIVHWISGLMYRFYSRRYFELSGADSAAVDRWMIVIAAARLIEDVPGEEEHVVKFVRERLASAH
jgi:uncharacterized protein (TIGR02172 family)